jgi:hypothetical protein
VRLSHKIVFILKSYVSFVVVGIAPRPQQWLRATYGLVNDLVSINEIGPEYLLPMLKRRLGMKDWRVASSHAECLPVHSLSQLWTRHTILSSLDQGETIPPRRKEINGKVELVPTYRLSK